MVYRYSLQDLQRHNVSSGAEGAVMANETIQSYRDLDAWKVGMELADAIYDLAGRLPDTERYGMRTQLQRAAVSVPSNVAEGQSYGPGRRYAHHVRIALGSVGEMSTVLELATRRRYLSGPDVASADRLLARSGQLLHGLRRSIRFQQLGSATVWLTLLVPPAWWLLAILD
jgi:four helix bundle protein